MPIVIPPVPAPANPTYPTGSTGSSEWYGLVDTLANGAVLDSVLIDKLTDTVDNCIAAALAGAGEGTILGGAFGTPVGLNVSVTAWRGILPQSTVNNRLGFAGGVANAAALTINDNSTFVVWATPVSGTYSDVNSTPYDTAQSGAAALEIVYDGSSPDGATPLFSGVTAAGTMGTLVDQRIPSGSAQLAAAIAALTNTEAADIALLHTIIGLAYFPSGGGATPSNIATRLTALEGAGTAATPSVYWSGLAASATDTTLLKPYIASQLPAAAPPVTPTQLTNDNIAANILKAGFGLLDGFGVTTFTDRFLDCVFLDLAVTGSMGIDLVATTAALDTSIGGTGLIG